MPWWSPRGRNGGREISQDQIESCRKFSQDFDDMFDHFLMEAVEQATLGSICGIWAPKRWHAASVAADQGKAAARPPLSGGAPMPTTSLADMP